MKFIIESGSLTDIDELEKLYDELNDHLSATTNYPGWIKGIYPVRENAVAGVNNQSLFVARCGGRIPGSVILDHQPEEAYENIYARADLGKYAAAEDVMKLRKMMELTIKGLMNERILEDAFQPEMLYEEILEYLQLSRRLAERSGQPSDEEITEK